MQNMLLVLHLLICVVLVGAVLMQRSEGGALGMGGGGGGLISGRGAADMMVNITSWVGGAFFVTSIILTVLAGARPVDRSVITDGQRPQSGIHFNLPFFNQGAAKKEAAAPVTTAPSPALPAPEAATIPVGAAVAPTPVEAVTHAGPLDTAASTDSGAPKAAPAASLPAGASQRVAGPVVAGPVGGAPARTAASVGGATPKTTQRPAANTQRVAPVPMIPLPTQTLPTTAPATESPQPATPAPAPRERTGPDE